MAQSESEFTNREGEELIKQPGTINGESFDLKNLNNCTVYLLDYSSSVEVSNCVDCRILIGPVDGAAIFENCSGCEVAVACQQFQAKSCSDMTFGIYCGTAPTLTSCQNIRVQCWMGAYPGLTAQFEAAKLKPQANKWHEVHETDNDFGGEPNFEVVESPTYWEVPIDGFGSLENPVPAPDGTIYTAPAMPDSNGGAAGFGFDKPAENGIGGLGDALGGSGHSFTSAGRSPTGPLTPMSDNPKVAAMQDALRKRVAAQEEKETKGKQELTQKAAKYLESFYERRNAQKQQRQKTNREAEKEITISGPNGDTEWERALDYINFGFQRPNGSDIARMKSLLFSAKSKQVPVSKN